jgi:hypothetical protein
MNFPFGDSNQKLCKSTLVFVFCVIPAEAGIQMWLK